eukprot:NODE_2546_length_905_cov_43.324766_g2091_i0.p3 GENE.NODE_2546_length_905_cov_43.324766_g2091_i0~~NODE_2546_length_905_cov_43.324766_g2091_i0.p3  ORF type:complete len:71 (-),score=5.48 NODE_2546_length_905_cov_43.324766_g2091_i0:190-402(-)
MVYGLHPHNTLERRAPGPPPPSVLAQVVRTVYTPFMQQQKNKKTKNKKQLEGSLFVRLQNTFVCQSRRVD